MVTDDQYVAVLERTRETGGLVMVHAENGWEIDRLVRQALAAGNTDPINHALTRPGGARGRGDRRAPCASPSTPGVPVFIVHVTCRDAADAIIAARARGVPAYGETCLQYLLLTEDDLRRPELRGRALRLLAAAADDGRPGRALGRARLRPPADRLDRPLPVHRRAEAARAARLLEDPERPRGDPAPADDALGARRAHRQADAEPARRDHVELGREAVRAVPAEGHDRARAPTPTS